MEIDYLYANINDVLHDLNDYTNIKKEIPIIKNNMPEHTDKISILYDIAKLPLTIQHKDTPYIGTNTVRSAIRDGKPTYCHIFMKNKEKS